MHVKAVNIFGQLKVMQTIYKLYHFAHEHIWVLGQVS